MQMSIKINHILLIAVLAIFAFILSADKNLTYLRHAQDSLIFLVALTLFSIIINFRLRSAFLELLNIVFVVFYVGRIPFTYDDNVLSDVLSRGVNIENIGDSINVLSFQYFCLVVCIIILNPKMVNLSSFKLPDLAIKRVLKFSFFILFFNAIYIFSIWKIGETSLPNGLAILQAIFSYSSILWIISPTLIMLDGKTQSRYAYIIFMYLFVVVMIVIYSGSKSGLLQVFLALLLSIIVIHGTSYRINLRMLVALAGGLFLSVVLYYAGLGYNQYQRGELELSGITDFLDNGLDNFSKISQSISYRIGYLDFFIDKYSSEVYRSVIRVDNYFMAIVDALTPGFDVFHVPLVSRAVFNAFFGRSVGPNSEALTVFAEAQILFGIFSFLEYSCILLALKWALGRAKSQDYFIYCLFSLYVISVFYGFLSGWGLDFWFTNDVVYGFIFFSLSIWYIKPSLRLSKSFSGK